jgi:hypothetical protein
MWSEQVSLRNRRYVLAATAIAALLLPLAVTSTPPAIDWYIFDVRGSVTRPSGSLANHPVQLYGNCQGSQQLSPIGTCSGEGAEEYGPFTKVSLTDDNGRFHVRVSVCGSGYPACDTLMIAVVYPDTTVFGTPFVFNGVRPTTIEKTGTAIEEDTGVFDCSGKHEYTYVDGYIYTYPELTIPVP